MVLLVAVGGAVSTYHSEASCHILARSMRAHGKRTFTREVTAQIAQLRGLHPCPFCHDSQPKTWGMHQGNNGAWLRIQLLRRIGGLA